MAFRLRWIAETEVTLIIAFYRQLTKGCVNFLVQSQTVCRQGNMFMFTWNISFFQFQWHDWELVARRKL